MEAKPHAVLRCEMTRYDTIRRMIWHVTPRYDATRRDMACRDPRHTRAHNRATPESNAAQGFGCIYRARATLDPRRSASSAASDPSALQ